MGENKPPESSGAANSLETILDYVVHQYGLIRDQAREEVKQCGAHRSTRLQGSSRRSAGREC